jgi:uncharacterized protein (TIGR00251 family)
VKISVKAKPSRKEAIEQIDAVHFVVRVKEPPVEGRANEAIVATLAKHFGVPRKDVRIVSGRTSRQKIIEIRS